MNLDALFEDLEAQAYFQSIQEPRVESSAAKLALVIGQSQGKANLVISSPLLGLDFVAGFTNKNAPCWIVLPNSSFSRVELLDGGFSLAKTDFGFIELIESTLLSVPLRITTRHGDLDAAIFTAVTNSIAEILYDGRISYLSFSAIESLVVENLSSLQRISAP